MYQGIQKKGLEFYTLLEQSEEFTSELGKVVLASGKLEARLIVYLKNNKVNQKFEKKTLGKLIQITAEHNLISENEKSCFEMILYQRNYLTHNIYSLFNYSIDRTILEREGLLDSDVITYIEKVWQLKENIDALIKIIDEKTK